MKPRFNAILSTVIGITVLAGLFLQAKLIPFLPYLLDFVILLTAASTLIAIAFLLLRHLRRIGKGSSQTVLSIVLVVSFGLTFIGGLVFGVDNPDYSYWVAAIQRPLQASLLGLSALVMAAAALKLFQRKGVNLLTISFGLSAFFFLLLGMNISHLFRSPQVEVWLTSLSQVPLIGARGLLIGMGIGGLFIAVRILFGIERPYDER
ncbi:MAG: hypothetical protein VB108_07765 [Anaerolineaceae bacterium]|nr:hypothetical protein [Anaerolineaceae bacterium]